MEQVDREASFAAEFELALQRASAEIVGPFEAEENWLDAIKVALAAFLRLIERDPAVGRVLLLDSMRAGEAVQRRRIEVLNVLAAAVEGAAENLPAGRYRPPPVIAEGVVGAVLAIVQNRMTAPQADPLIKLFGELVSIVVLPYLGFTVARREQVRPAPRPRVAGESSATARAALTHNQRSRLTYRTARVLHAIADYPGASNREVAERSGIVDQGQISKLLGRLEAGGTIANIGVGRTRGAPNAWQLTAEGERVLSEQVG